MDRKNPKRLSWPVFLSHYICCGKLRPHIGVKFFNFCANLLCLQQCFQCSYLHFCSIILYKAPFYCPGLGGSTHLRYIPGVEHEYRSDFSQTEQLRETWCLSYRTSATVVCSTVNPRCLQLKSCGKNISPLLIALVTKCHCFSFAGYLVCSSQHEDTLNQADRGQHPYIFAIAFQKAPLYRRGSSSKLSSIKRIVLNEGPFLLFP